MHVLSLKIRVQAVQQLKESYSRPRVQVQWWTWAMSNIYCGGEIMNFSLFLLGGNRTSQCKQALERLDCCIYDIYICEQGIMFGARVASGFIWSTVLFFFFFKIKSHFSSVWMYFRLPQMERWNILTDQRSCSRWQSRGRTLCSSVGVRGQLLSPVQSPEWW